MFYDKRSFLPSFTEDVQVSSLKKLLSSAVLIQHRWEVFLARLIDPLIVVWLFCSSPGLKKICSKPRREQRMATQRTCFVLLLILQIQKILVSIELNDSLWVFFMNSNLIKANIQVFSYCRLMHLGSWHPVVWHAALHLNTILKINHNYYACCFMSSYWETKWNICIFKNSYTVESFNVKRLRTKAPQGTDFGLISEAT